MITIARAASCPPSRPSTKHSLSDRNGAGARNRADLGRGFFEGPARVLEAKEHLFCEGDAASHVFLVEAGHVCTYRLMADGRRLVIDFAYPDDFIGLGALSRHAANAQAHD